MAHPARAAKTFGHPVPINLMPSTFGADYVENVVAPYILSNRYTGDQPVLQMLDLIFGKAGSTMAHIWGLLYAGWQDAGEEEGLTVFLQDYANRGPNNERKKIYYSAVTPDLYDPMYAPKIRRFVDQLFVAENAGQPLMHKYYEQYFDMYWDLHVGVTGDQIPAEMREIGQSFNAVLGFFLPTLDVVRENYMRVRELRQPLKDWLDARIQDVIDGKIPNPEATFVHYWVANGGLGENFRRKDVVFECFHNFLAFSQWGNTLYNVMARLQAVNGDPQARSSFQATMTNGPDEPDDGPFTPLDRLAMELFRTIAPNSASISRMAIEQGFMGEGYSLIFHPHASTSRDPRHWTNPDAFDPDRFKTARRSDQNDERRSSELGLAQCPFNPEAFEVNDGRHAQLTNSIFGTVYGVVDDRPYPVCDTAGYAPFGFGYRRCPGEFLTLNFIKDVLRKVWREHIEFETLALPQAEVLPVGPITVVQDNIGFHKAHS